MTNKEQIAEIICRVTHKTTLAHCDVQCDVMCSQYAEELTKEGYHKTIWHKVVDDDLPKEDHEIIFVSVTGDYHSGVYIKITNAFYTDGDIKYNIDEVIAWMEIPEYKDI